ncbi:MAG: DUF2520 domain-containing protein [Gemmatimonadetes bacterium]|nr:DUF2520 domain-containing protein [Gemmatimonadota bacterium]
MGPALDSTATRYGVIGDGHMALHMGCYFESLAVPYRRWSRRLEHDASLSLGTAVGPCQIVLVLINDVAIEPFITSHPELAEKTLVHFSGSLTTPHAQSMHPLSTFAGELYSLSTYATIPFVCEEGPHTFDEIFPELPNPHYTIAQELRPLYHSLAVLAGNCTTVLWSKLFDTFEERLALPRNIAVPYLKQVALNLELAPTNAATGPLVRGDRQTVDANIAALEGDPFQAVYRAFVEAVAPHDATSRP